MYSMDDPSSPDQAQEIDIAKRESQNRSFNNKSQQRQNSRQSNQQRESVTMKSPKQTEVDLTSNLMHGSQIIIGPQSAKHAQHAQDQPNVLNVLGEGQKPPATQFL